MEISTTIVCVMISHRPVGVANLATRRFRDNVVYWL